MMEPVKMSEFADGAAVTGATEFQAIQSGVNKNFSALEMLAYFSHPLSMADSAAAVNTIYYSTDAGKLVYKDAGGVVNALY